MLIIGVLDEENSLIQRFSHWREIRTLNTEIEHYRKQYERDSRELKELTSNPEELEKVAREKYLMKKENEDIYIFEEDLKRSRMSKYYSAIATVGAVALLLGAALQITQLAWAPYLYLIGAIMFAYVQVMSGYEGKNIIIRRLRRQQIIGATLLVVAGVMMILWKRNEWVVCLTIAAVLEMYTAFRIPQEEEKEKNK